MPTTDSGERLLADPDAYTYTRRVLADQIDMIEAEARADEAAARAGEFRAGINAERARIRAAVEGLNPQQDGDIVTLNGTRRRPVTPADYVELYRAAVLAIIDGEDTDDRP